MRKQSPRPWRYMRMRARWSPAAPACGAGAPDGCGAGATAGRLAEATGLRVGLLAADGLRRVALVLGAALVLRVVFAVRAMVKLLCVRAVEESEGLVGERGAAVVIRPQAVARLRCEG